jgi:Rod binding domain-containing protein
MEEVQLKITNELKHFKNTPTVNNSKGYSNSEKHKIADASKDFESMLTGMMLKSMTSSVNGFFGEESYGGDYFDSIFTMELASKMSSGSKLGLAEQIYQKVTGEKWSEDLLKENSKNINNDFNINTNKPDGNTKQINNEPEISVNSIKPSEHSLNRLKKFDGVIENYSKMFNINKNLIRSVILAESAGQPNAISKANAKGLMQLMDLTAKDMGVKNSFDPTENIFGGTKYLNQLLKKYNGNVELSLAAYNAGPGNVEKYNGIPPFEETKSYVSRVIGYYNYLNG